MSIDDMPAGREMDRPLELCIDDLRQRGCFGSIHWSPGGYYVVLQQSVQMRRKPKLKWAQGYDKSIHNALCEATKAMEAE